MSRNNTTTVKVSLEDVELIAWALYQLDKESLSHDQLDSLKRLEDRLSRAEDRVL